MKGLVSTAGLIRRSDNTLTGAGFRFLLMDTNGQVWVLLRDYIRSAEQASGALLTALRGGRRWHRRLQALKVCSRAQLQTRSCSFMGQCDGCSGTSADA